MGKANDPGPGPDGHWRARRGEVRPDRAAEARSAEGYLDDAETVVVAFGTAAKFVAHVVEELRAEGHRVGWFRPVTLWPFPAEALARATAKAQRVLVFELNAGQLVDERPDARRRPVGRAVHRGVSISESGWPTAP